MLKPCHPVSKNLFLFVLPILMFSCFLKPEHFETVIIMEDGIALSTDVYVPKGKGKYPTILVRTPYNKGTEAWVGDAFGLKRIAVVIQDVRGKYKSEGDFYPFVNERSDGLETLKWIREQPWSNGVVGGWGSSYVGYTQWAVSDKLDYMVPLVTGANIYDFVYPDGLFSLQSAFTWGLMIDAKTANTIPSDDLKNSFSILPLSGADDSTIHDIAFLNDWLAHDSYDAYWKQMDHRGIATNPVLCIAGWYDIFLKSQIEDFEALQTGGHPDSKMVIGPFCHGSQGMENDYGGIKKTGKPIKIFLYTAKILKGKTKKMPSPLKQNKYNLFVMERNEYFGSDLWPPEETTITPYFIGPDNYLRLEPVETEGSVIFDYDPRDPYPSLGGTALGEKVGPALQNSNLDRSDQVSFETDTLGSPLILLGPISATLWLSSSAPCTDFFICIQDVFPDGRIVNIQEGGKRVELNEGTPVRHEFSVWATGYQLNAGHKLRVVITSSWFPRYNRNLNDCKPIAEAKDPIAGRQVIHFGPEVSSRIDLPVYHMTNDQ